MKRSTHRPKTSGFSLIELLLVIAVIALLSALAYPAVTALTGSGNVNKSISQLSDTLELAREYAVANNTYVWVAFCTPPATGSSTSYVAVLSANDGKDAGGSSWPTYNYGTAPNSQLSLVSKVLVLKQIYLQTAASFPVSSLPPNPAVTSSNNSFAVATSGGFFTMTIPGAAAPIVFTQVIEFQPTGQARNSSTPIDVIDVDLQPVVGAVGTPSGSPPNGAILRVNGLTGETVVYRE